LARADRVVTMACELRLNNRSSGLTFEIPMQPIPLRAARPGTFRRYAAPHAATFFHVPESALREAQFVNDVVAGLDAVRDVDALLDRATEAQALIRRECRAPSLAPSAREAAAARRRRSPR